MISKDTKKKHDPHLAFAFSVCDCEILLHCIIALFLFFNFCLVSNLLHFVYHFNGMEF